MKVRFLAGTLFVFAFVFAGKIFAADDPFESSFKSIESQIQSQDDKKIQKQIKAASGRFPIAMMMMANASSYGQFGADRDPDDAFSYEEKAAKKGFRPAISLVAKAHFTGKNGSKSKPNEKKAFDYCSDADLLHYYAVLLESSDSDERKNIIKKLRSRKDADNAVVLAYCLLRGAIIPQDTEEAVSILEGAIKRSPNHGESLYVLSQCCRNGVGMVRDMKRADELLTKAQDAGNPQALYFVLASGTPYFASSSTHSRFNRSQNDEESEAAESNFASDAQIYDFQGARLERTYMRADQVDRPLVKLLNEKHIDAAKKLADAGDVAMVALMYEIYKYGLGVKEDEATAESWFNKRKYFYLMDTLAKNASSSRLSSRSGKKAVSSYEAFQDKRAAVVGKTKRRAAVTALAEDDYDPTASSSTTRHVAARRTIVEGVDVGDAEWNALR